MKDIITIVLLFSLPFLSQAQMVNGVDTLYGNEWVQYDQTYHKVNVSEDGLYRISGSTLQQAGVPIEFIASSQYQLFRLGKPVPVYVSSQNTLGSNDYVEFYGIKNRGEFDQYLYTNAEEKQFNAEYSMFSDTSVYFLTWSVSSDGLQFTDVVNDISNAPPALEYYLHTEKVVFSEAFTDLRFDQGVSLSSYEQAEGFASTVQKDSETKLPVSNVFASGPAATFEVILSTTKRISNHIEVLVGGDLVDQDTVSFIQMRKYEHSLAANALTEEVSVVVKDLNGSNSRHVIANVSSTYPRTFDLGSERSQFFTLPASSEKTLIEVNVTGSNGDPVAIYDLTNARRLVATTNNDLLQFAIPSSTEDMEVFVLVGNNENALPISNAVSFSDWSSDNSDFIIISHPRLFDPSITGTANYVQEYVDYRKSPEGGNYNAAYYNILDIYDLFGYGIANHPQSVRNFAHFVHKNWSSSKAFFIIGKGIQYNSSRVPAPGLDDYHFIPTFGYPGADNLLVSSIWSELPLFPIGRIAVINAGEVHEYLEKVKEYESANITAQTIEERAWMHQVMHLGGGIDAVQQAQLENTLNGIGNVLINGSYGAEITTYTKTSTAPVGLTKSQKILHDLERGVTLVNFYGHSSASTLDFQVNTPRDWNNKGKYPIFSAMGCSAGQVHSDFRSLSEIFTFEPGAGTIAFIAGSGSQFTSPLAAWGSSWYKSFGDKSYGNKLGESLLESYIPLNSFANSGSLTHRLLLQQQTLNGDPMIPFYTYAGPDFITEYASVRFNPEVITVTQDSLKISFDILNIGKSLTDTTINVEIIQRYPSGGSVAVFDTSVIIDGFRSSQEISFALDGARSKGKNTFFINLDTDNQIEELPGAEAENNNELVSELGQKGIDIFIIDNRMFASRPKKFSIVNKPFVELIGTSNNAFLKGKAYVMEIDTTRTFDSPMRLGERFLQFGSVVRWTPPVTLTPNTVYYWRVSTDSLSVAEPFLWDYSSFIYLPESEPGWNQSHYYQFGENTFDKIRLDEQSRRFEFSDKYKNIWVRNLIQETTENRCRLFIDQQLQGEFFTSFENNPGNVFIMAIHPFKGGILANNPGGDHGSTNETGQRIRVFPFNTAEQEGRESLMNFIENVIETNWYIVMYTFQRPGYMDYMPEVWEDDVSTYGKSIYDVIEDQYPGSQIRSLKDLGSRPYVLFLQKDVGVIEESLSLLEEETLSVEYNFPSKNLDGDMYSQHIGPSKEWKSLYLDFSEVTATTDTALVSLWGINAAGENELLFSRFNNTDTSLSWVSAEQYPFLQLQFHAADRPARTIPQVAHWRITYTPFADLILNPTAFFDFQKDTLFEGQRLSLTTGVENIGSTAIDETLMQVTITNLENLTITDFVEVPSLGPGERSVIHYENDMLGQSGPHTLFVELNPQFRPEDQFENNTGFLEFFVETDKLNPLLDVTFDGVHIKDGDLVSAKPLIQIFVEDENQFFALDDTSNISLFIKYPFDFEFQPISLMSPEIQFFPADLASGENKMRIEYRPTFSEDGIYEFRAQATDASGNVSGDAAYTISFEVLNARKISKFSVFPNPFRTTTRFVYTLTGDQVPEEFYIQIFSLSGQLVREITQAEIGPLRVGTHMTDVAWDGSGANGVLLGSGTYLYRVIAKNADGSDYEEYKNGTSQAFRKDFGKLIIIR